MTTFACDIQCQELVRWAVAIAIPAAAGLAGVAIGAWLTGRRERGQRRLAYVERQLKEFYSPIMGLRSELRMHGELRVRIHDAADTVWRELCAQAREVSVETLGVLSRSRGSEFMNIIEYDNKKLQADLLPAYHQMAKLFRENLWLAEPETRSHYASLIEFVELWERWLAKAIPAEVIERLEHSEEKLHDFYEHLQQKHEELRQKLQAGSA